MSRFEQAWFGPVWLLLGLARLAILAVPFRRMAPALGHHVQNVMLLPVVTPRQRQRAVQIARTIRLAARYTPWTSNCFPQAIAARVMLGIYGVPYVLFFGVSRRKARGMDAHAWVWSGPVAVSGGNGFHEFAVVGTFVSAELARVTRAGA